MLSTIIKKRTTIYKVFVFLIIFLFSVFPYADYDWGWHYRYGEYLLTHGSILRDNIFSWTLPHYQWVNNSWLYDPILYVLTRLGGFIGLSLAGALVVTGTLFVLLLPYRLSYWKVAVVGLFFLMLSQPGIGVGLRSQVISLLFFATEMMLLVESRRKSRLLFFLVPLFLLWVNMHGDFLLGLGVAAVFLATDYIVAVFKTKHILKSINLRAFVVLALSFLVTWINPFGYRIYLEPFQLANNPYLRNIFDWQPIFTNCSYCHPNTFILYCLILLATFAVALKRKDFSTLPYIILACMLFYPTVTTRRLLPIFTVITIPLFAQTLMTLKWDMAKYKITDYVVILLIIIAVWFNFFSRFNTYYLYHYTDVDYCWYSSGCSPKLTAYLITHPPQGRGFNDYDQGGYLIGKGVRAKLFIDGRMHVWEEHGYQPFADYSAIYYNDQYDVFQKYHFDWALIDDLDLARKLYYTNDLGTWQLRYRDGNIDYFVRLHSGVTSQSILPR